MATSGGGTAAAGWLCWDRNLAALPLEDTTNQAPAMSMRATAHSVVALRVTAPFPKGRTPDAVSIP